MKMGPELEFNALVPLGKDTLYFEIYILNSFKSYTIWVSINIINQKRSSATHLFLHLPNENSPTNLQQRNYNEQTCVL